MTNKIMHPLSISTCQMYVFMRLYNAAEDYFISYAVGVFMSAVIYN